MNIKRIVSAPLDVLIQLFYFLKTNKTYDIRDTIIVSGSPRSGTSWLAETILSLDKTHRLLWEPMYPNNPEYSKLSFSARPFISNSVSTPQIHTFFERLLKGEMLNTHTLRLSKHPKHFFYIFGNGRWIIKFVRGNGIAAYLRQHFKIKKPVTIIRHPCAVVASQMRMAFSDHPLIDPELITCYPHINNILPLAKTQEEKLALTWACDTLMAQRSKDHLQIIYYEDLLRKPKDVLRPLLEEWDLDVSTLDAIDTKRKSSMWRHWSVDANADKKLSEWKKALKPESIDKILSIITQTGITLYDDDPLKTPKKE